MFPLGMTRNVLSSANIFVYRSVMSSTNPRRPVSCEHVRDDVRERENEQRLDGVNQPGRHTAEESTQDLRQPLRPVGRRSGGRAAGCAVAAPRLPDAARVARP
jgi:hypothetical protein